MIVRLIYLVTITTVVNNDIERKSAWPVYLKLVYKNDGDAFICLSNADSVYLQWKN